jgi:hypothetical protein
MENKTYDPEVWNSVRSSIVFGINELVAQLPNGYEVTSKGYNYFIFETPDKRDWRVDLTQVDGHYAKWTGTKLKLKVCDYNQSELTASSTKIFEGDSYCQQDVLDFLDGKLTKMIQSCYDRQKKIQKRLEDKLSERDKAQARAGYWRSVIKSLDLPKGNDTYFHDTACTTMQIKIEPGNEQMIAEVLAALSGQHCKTILSEFEEMPLMQKMKQHMNS